MADQCILYGLYPEWAGWSLAVSSWALVCTNHLCFCCAAFCMAAISSRMEGCIACEWGVFPYCREFHWNSLIITNSAAVLLPLRGLSSLLKRSLTKNFLYLPCLLLKQIKCFLCNFPFQELLHASGGRGPSECSVCCPTAGKGGDKGRMA